MFAAAYQVVRGYALSLFLGIPLINLSFLCFLLFLSEYLTILFPFAGH